MVNVGLIIVLIGGVLLIASSPQLRLQITGFFARKQGEAIQRSITGGKLFDVAGAEIQREITGGQTFAEVSEATQREVLGGSVISDIIQPSRDVRLAGKLSLFRLFRGF